LAAFLFFRFSKPSLHLIVSLQQGNCLNLTPIKSSKTYHLSILISVLFLSLFFASRVTQLKFNYDFEAFFPNEDNELELYNQFRDKFEYDNEFILIAVENKNGIFRKDFLQQIDSLTHLLANVPDIRQVSSPTNLKETKLTGLVPIQVPLLNFEEPERYKQDSTRIYQSPQYVGSYFPRDAQSISLFLKTEDVLSKKRSDLLANSVRSVLAQFKFEDVHVVGRIFAQQVYLTNIQGEFFWFLAISFVLVVIFLWFTFRRPYGVIVPVVVVLIGMLWTLGIMQVMGKSIDIMAIMLPTMIFVAGMSDVVHFFSRYFEELAKGTDANKIYGLILKEVGFPTFLTLLTTVVGFLSLLFSSIQPVRDFGIFTSIGVTLAFILTYTLLPAILYFYTPKKLIERHSKDQGGNPHLAKLLIFVLRKRKLVLLSTLIVLMFTAFGISKIRINNILLEDLSDKVRIKQDFRFFDQHYSGVRPLELQIDILNDSASVLDYSCMRQLDSLDRFIAKEYHAGFLLSPASLVKSIYSSSSFSPTSNFPSASDYEEYQGLLLKNRKNKDIRKIISADGKTARISAKIRDVGSMAVKEHNAALVNYIDQHVSKDVKIQITGAAHLMDRNNEYMVDNMAQGFVFSFIVIALLTLFLHRDWKMILVFLLPNFIPLVIIAGIMGFANIELKAATSLVFSIAFGIATDDTIHFISRLKIELGYGKSLLYALKRTYLETGKPIVMTTFILVGGFVSLMTSNFESTFYFGFLICITMVIAVLADLLLLPALLIMIYGGKKKQA
jgi:hypothetical protein